MALQTSTKLTYEDFLLLPDDGRRHEILDGEHYVNPSPNTKHQMASMRLVLAFGDFVYEHSLGQIFHAPYDVVLSGNDILEPDLIFVSAARRAIITDANIQGAPDLVVEILSPNNRGYDERVKYQTYERFGVGEYWIVDPEAETVTVYRRAGDKFVRAESGDAITTPLLPGFSLEVAAIFL
ncbi:MAG TPA: Uma2 family endonuclease [Thermoanaerobaculia bacterium]|nr:Uma2 family endonuclease [Thermoanaerobaculia bacterium]